MKDVVFNAALRALFKCLLCKRVNSSHGDNRNCSIRWDRGIGMYIAVANLEMDRRHILPSFLQWRQIGTPSRRLPLPARHGEPAKLPPLPCPLNWRSQGGSQGTVAKFDSYDLAVLCNLER